MPRKALSASQLGLVKPTKTVGNKNYKAGRAFEYSIKAEMKEKGFGCMRTAGSHGEADLIVYSPLSFSKALADPMSAREMMDKVGEGWMHLPPSEVLGEFISAYGRSTGKVEYRMHIAPVLTVFIQAKRSKRRK